VNKKLVFNARKAMELGTKCLINMYNKRWVIKEIFGEKAKRGHELFRVGK